MTDIQTLEKALKRRKRIASEWAMQLHDLAEEGLPAAFEELPGLAESTYRACQEWQQAAQALKEAKG